MSQREEQRQVEEEGHLYQLSEKRREPTRFSFREEGNDNVHTFVGVSVGPVKAGQLCFRHGEWEQFRGLLAGLGQQQAIIEVVDYEPWPGE